MDAYGRDYFALHIYDREDIDIVSRLRVRLSQDACDADPGCQCISDRGFFRGLDLFGL